MDENLCGRISEAFLSLGIQVTDKEVAGWATDKAVGGKDLGAFLDLLLKVKAQRDDLAATTLLRLSRMPLKMAKTFEDYDFSRMGLESARRLQALQSLTFIQANRNILITGDVGVGKTHLVLAIGMECCKRRMRVYYLKMQQLREKLHKAIELRRTGRLISSLVRPTVLIIDEVGYCKLDREETQVFFHIMDRRYEKDTQSTILTSNRQASKWSEFFSDDDALLCALDRLCDNSLCFNIYGDSYRGKNKEMIKIRVGNGQRG